MVTIQPTDLAPQLQRAGDNLRQKAYARQLHTTLKHLNQPTEPPKWNSKATIARTQSYPTHNTHMADQANTQTLQRTQSNPGTRTHGHTPSTPPTQPTPFDRMKSHLRSTPLQVCRICALPYSITKRRNHELREWEDKPQHTMTWLEICCIAQNKRPFNSIGE